MLNSIVEQTFPLSTGQTFPEAELCSTCFFVCGAGRALSFLRKPWHSGTCSADAAGKGLNYVAPGPGPLVVERFVLLLRAWGLYGHLIIHFAVL